MNTKSKIFKSILVGAVTVAAAVGMSVMGACGGSASASGSYTIGVDDTAGSGFMQAQISSMLGGVIEVTLDVEGDSYTYSKEYYTLDADTNTKTIDCLYTFTGTVSSSSGDTYTLAPATGCTYSLDYGVYYETFAPIGCIPVEPGTGTEADDPACLNYFYGPYLVNAGGNTKSNVITITDGVLSFEGFTFGDGLDD